MKKAFRIVAVFLIASLLAMPCVYANTQYTEEEIAGGAVKLSEIDFPGKTFSQISGEEGSFALADENYTFSGDGMEMDGNSGYAAFNYWKADYSSWGNGFYQIRFKFAGDGCFNLQMRKDGSDKRMVLQVFKDKVQYYGSFDETNSYSSTTLAHDENTWYTYLIAAGSIGYDFYRKTDSETTYTKVASAPYATNSQSGNQVQFGPFQGSTATVSSFKVFGEPKPTAAEEEILAARKSKHAVLFTDSVGSGTENACVTNGVLEMKPQGALEQYLVKGIHIPSGGAAKVSFKMNQTNMEIAIGDGSTRMRLSVNNTTVYYADGTGNKSVSMPHENNVWYTYLVEDVGTGYKFWRKAEGEVKYTLVAESTGKNASALNGCGFYTSGSSGSCVTVDSVYIYTPSGTELENLPVLEDKDAIAASKSETILVENFDSQNENWTYTDTEVNGGVLDTNPNRLTTDTIARISTSNMDLSGAYQMNVRIKLNEDRVESIIVKGGKRVYWLFWEDRMRVGANVAENNKQIPTRRGVWYDCIFMFNEDETVDVYRKESNCEYWETLYTGVPFEASSGDYLAFYGGGSSGKSCSVDSLKIFKDMQVETDEYTVNGNQLNVSAKAEYGTPASTNNRRMSIIAASSHKKHGYTTNIWEVDFPIVAATGGRGSASFDLSSVDMSQNNISVFFLDSMDTLHPLAKSQGYATENTAGDTPNEGKTEGVEYEAEFNEVKVRGFAGKVCDVMVAIMDGTTPKAMAVIPTGKYGMFEGKVAIDPSLPSGNYTLRVAYGNNKPEDYTVTLYGGDNNHNGIDSKEEFVSYIYSYAKQEMKDAVTDGNFAADAYTRFAAFKGENHFADFYTFRSALEKSIADERTERELLASITGADWATIRTLVTVTYKDFIGIDLHAMADVTNEKGMFSRMVGLPYSSAEDVKAAYLDAATKQVAADKAPATENIFASNGGGGGGGGFSAAGTSAGIGGAVSGETAANETTNKRIEDFPDLDTVPWAADGINELHRRGIVSGDENGNFNPDNPITREEFLKILMGAASIYAEQNGELHFTDVEPNAWYFSFVNAAYQNGIVKGISSEEFGIGRNITRADMAVLMKRVLDFRQVDVKPIERAFVFSDFDLIPDYARESIFFLCEAGLMNGVGNNLFAPDAFATRAEAATVIHRVYQYMNEGR